MLKPLVFEGSIQHILNEDSVEQKLTEDSSQQFMVGVWTDLAAFSLKHTKDLKLSNKRVLVYSIDSNESIWQNASPEEIQLPTFSEDHVGKLLKKFSKLHALKKSRTVEIETKKKNKAEVHHFGKKKPSKYLKPTQVKYETMVESTFYGSVL